jgi:DNA end-binding protein Ku
MSARAIWKASLKLGKLTVPVKLYSAVKDQSIHFHLLHNKDFVRLEQRMVNPATNKTVPYDEQLRGYEVERGVFVKLSADELASLEPEASRDIEVTQFAAPELVDRSRFLRPYWLGPDGDEEKYFALAAALAEAEKVGVAQWVMRKKSYVGALTVADEHLLLTTLRSDAETISASDLPAPAGRELSAQEKQLARQLIGALEADFEPGKFRDEYRARVAALLKAKQRGETVEPAEYKPKRQGKSLVDTLKSSLESVA